MDVLALVGPSGTGKSHRALQVAHDHNADAIIDDGILIKDGKIMAGFSAKKEKSRIMAVRRAIFVLPGHAENVREALETLRPHRLLLLGTSENMVHKIAKMLKIPKIAKIIRIEDIASKGEMEKAQFHRLKEGKHIIPVPTIELKPHFSGYLIDPLQSFFKKSSTRRRKLGEKSIVRPVFSYYGHLRIDDSVMKDILTELVRKYAEVVRIHKVRVRHILKGDEDQGIDLFCSVSFRYGTAMQESLLAMREEGVEAIERMTGMLVHRLDILVEHLVVEKRLDEKKGRHLN